MLSRLVLPAPLGPITDMISPLDTSRLTCDTACTPPKDFDTSRISSSALTTATACRRRGPRRPPPRPPPGSIAVAKPLEAAPPHTQPTSASRQPPLPPAVVLDVAVALTLAHAAEAQIEL